MTELLRQWAGFVWWGACLQPRVWYQLIVQWVVTWHLRRMSNRCKHTCINQPAAYIMGFLVNLFFGSSSIIFLVNLFSIHGRFSFSCSVCMRRSVCDATKQIVTVCRFPYGSGSFNCLHSVVLNVKYWSQVMKLVQFCAIVILDVYFWTSVSYSLNNVYVYVFENLYTVLFRIYICLWGGECLSRASNSDSSALILHLISMFTRLVMQSFIVFHSVMGKILFKRILKIQNKILLKKHFENTK